MIGLALFLQIAVPAPRGFVNDFAGVLDAQSIRHMEAVITEVRQQTRGEIAVVTLSDIGDRSPSDVALRIGRQWGVGATGAAGDPVKNLGVVVLLVPLKDHKPGTGQVFIATGRGAEGFLTDARSGRIRDAMIPYLAREEYGTGVSLGVDLIAQAIATEFGVTLSNPEYVRPPPPPPPTPPRPRIPVGWLVIAILVLIVITRGRIFLLPFWLSGMGRGWGRGSWGGGWGGGGGRWGGGGGFGGFGGGGGFSGGGAGGRF